MRKRLTLILIYLMAITSGNAQQPAFFMFGQAQFEGIDIYNIIQDHSHNYWFATDQGIYKHDGYRFDKIECEQMKANSVFNFAINSKGVIYCSNLSQQVFQIKDGKCSLIFTIPDPGMDINIRINKQDEVYISTSKKVYVLNSKHQLIHSPTTKTISSLGQPYMLADGSIIQHWSNSTKALVYKNRASRTIELSTFSNCNGSNDVLHFFRLGARTYGVDNWNKDVYLLNEKTLSTTKTSSILADEAALLRCYPIENHLWISDNIAGVSILDNTLNRTHSSQKIFSDYFISFIYQDHEGNILLATFDEGIIVVPDIEIADVESKFSDYKITRMVKGSDNELLLGTRDGGILKYNGQIETISTCSNKGVEKIFYWPIHELILDDTKSLSVHFGKNQQQSLNSGSLKDAVLTKPDEVLLAMNSGVFTLHYDPATKSFHHGKKLLPERSYSIEKEGSTIYVSTASGLKFSPNYKTFRLLKNDGTTIHALDIEEYNGKTYVASSRHGILIFRNGKIIEQLHPKYNNEDLTIFKLIIQQKKIYANTQFGLIILNLKGEIINVLNKSTGLTANKIVDFELFQNQLWITHSRGIQRFNLSEINTKVSPPSVTIREIRINRIQLENISTQGSFNSNQRNLKFVFQVSTLKHRENIRYHFKLEGYNKDWFVNNYENNEVIYNALAPGQYSFILKAENNGVFSKPVRYSFHISAPFYLRWWFLVLSVIVCLAIISLIYLRQLNIHKKKAQQINELNSSRLTAIQSQMNPHFIFNSLNSIQDLVLKGDVDNSYTYITTFSNLVRRTLNYSDKDFIDFEQEIKLIELYLSLEKLRFKEDLDFSINTNEIEDIMIPPMLIQPFIENALVHGLLHKKGVKKLEINFSLKDVLICEIIDNGIGREKAMEIKNRQRANHESFAVNAIKRRFNILKEHFKGELGFKMEDIVTDTKVEGTKVTVQIPIKNKY